MESSSPRNSLESTSQLWGDRHLQLSCRDFYMCEEDATSGPQTRTTSALSNQPPLQPL